MHIEAGDMRRRVQRREGIPHAIDRADDFRAGFRYYLNQRSRDPIIIFDNQHAKARARALEEEGLMGGGGYGVDGGGEFVATDTKPPLATQCNFSAIILASRFSKTEQLRKTIAVVGCQRTLSCHELNYVDLV